MSHEKQKKEAQIRRRWFISTHMYIGKCEFWVVARKGEKWGPNSPSLIYFHAHVYWKMWLFSCRTKIRKKRPKFAAADLFPRACILENVTFELSHEKQKKEAQICRRWFISTRMYIGKCEFWVVARKSEKWGPNSPPLIYFHAQVLRIDFL